MKLHTNNAPYLCNNTCVTIIKTAQHRDLLVSSIKFSICFRVVSSGLHMTPSVRNVSSSNSKPRNSDHTSNRAVIISASFYELKNTNRYQYSNAESKGLSFQRKFVSLEHKKYPRIGQLQLFPISWIYIDSSSTEQPWIYISVSEILSDILRFLGQVMFRYSAALSILE